VQPQHCTAVWDFAAGFGSPPYSGCDYGLCYGCCGYGHGHGYGCGCGYDLDYGFRWWWVNLEGWGGEGCVGRGVGTGILVRNMEDALEFVEAGVNDWQN
jgi:hypothetical protein